jgi:hypothetical protein
MINIRELDPDIIRPSMAQTLDPNNDRGGSKIVIIGKPGTGKTSLITSLLYDKRACFPSGIVMSGTEDSNHHYQTMFPSTFIYNSLDTEAIEKMVKRQKIAKKYLPNPWALMLLDDCTDDPKVLYTPLFQSIFKNGRHWNILFILSLQYCMDVKPSIRTNIDGTFILRETNLKNRKSLYENYAGVIPSFKLFCDIMNTVVGDYVALYIDNQTQSTNWQDCVFWYKSKPVPKGWRFGCEDYWAFHEQRFNHDYVESII